MDTVLQRLTAVSLSLNLGNLIVLIKILAKVIAALADGPHCAN